MSKIILSKKFSLGVKTTFFSSLMHVVQGIVSQKTNLTLLPALLLCISATSEAGISSGSVFNNVVSNALINSQPQTNSYADFKAINWSTAASQPYKVSEAQGEVINDRLYSFGGFDSQKSGYTPTNRAYVYDPIANTWTALAAMPTMNGTSHGGVTHAGFTNDGVDIYFAGGYTANAKGTGQIFGTKEVWKYSVAENSYERLTDLPIIVAAGQLEYLNGKLHHISGTNLARTKDLSDHFVLDLKNMSAGWKRLSPLPNPRQHAASAVFEGKIYYIGGQTGHDKGLVTKKEVHRYDPGNDTWERLADLPVPDSASGRGHISSSVTVMGNRILVLAGETTHITGRTNMVSAYTPATNTWENLTPMPASRYSGVVGLLNGNIYYTGGASATTYKGVPLITNYNQQVETLTLINADNNQDIQTLANGATLNLATLPTTRFNIRANTNPSRVGSVVFNLSGTQSITATETAAPYALFGDDTKGGYYAWTPAEGSYTLKATPYTAAKGTGTAGSTLTIRFNVVNQPQAIVNNVQVTSNSSYVITNLAVGKLMYTDRSYKITAVPPSLSDATLIQTANDDKRNTSTSLLSFDVSQQATVYVAYDPRGTALPAWLNSWQKNTDNLGVNDSKISTMHLYSKTFAAGKVTLGGNMASPAVGSETNYLVIVVPASQTFTGNHLVKALPQAIQQGAGLRVYPNPSTGNRVQVEAQGFAPHEKVTVTLYTMVGKAIMSYTIIADKQGEAFVELPVSNKLKQGIYFVKARAVARSLQSKLIIQ